MIEPLGSAAVWLIDPVSSLDHKRRDAIAARLAKEAKLRQVIVFTHDLAFVCDLETAAGDGEVSCCYQHLDRHAGIPGKVIDGLPWDGESSKQQMKTLRELVGKANRVRTNGSDTDYREAAMPVIGKLRGACERIIEEVLLNRVVRRHDSKMNVGYLESVAAVTAEQFKAVYVIWRGCSNVIEAHAKPRSGPVNVPEPNVLDKWVGDLETLTEAVRTARKGVAVSPAPIVPAKAPAMA